MTPVQAALALLVIAAAVRWYVYPTRASSVSGPLLARYTPLPYWFAAYRLELPIWVHDLHRRYGHVVQIAPNYVSVASVDQLGLIYNTLDKEAFYEQFINYSVPNMFNTRSKKDHVKRRRLLAAQYSRAGVNTPEHVEMMCSEARDLAEHIKQEAESCKDRTVDLMEAFSFLAMDVLTAFAFGVGNGTACFSDAVHRHFCAESIRRRPFLNQLAPHFVSVMTSMGLSFLHTPKAARNANAFVESFTEKLGDRAGAASDSVSTLDSADADAPGSDAYSLRSAPTPFAALAQSGVLSRSEILSEVLDHIGAGMDTTSTTLTYLFYELARHPPAQAELRSSLPLRPSSPLEYLTALEDTPLLTAVIKETLRLHAAIPGLQPRAVPPEGMVLPGSRPIVLKGGAVVAAQGWTLHRDEAAFGFNAEVWKPERWLGKDEDETRRMEKAMMPFGRGSRACIGKDLAMAEMRVATAELIRRYDFVCPQAAGIGTSGMELGESGNYTRAPNAPVLRLVIRELEERPDVGH